jgi:pimeloyl-ACP methyl ester carboxylesterase
VILLHGIPTWSFLSDAERLADDLPRAALRTIPDGSHWLPYDHPESTAQALRRFVTEA